MPRAIPSQYRERRRARLHFDSRSLPLAVLMIIQIDYPSGVPSWLKT